MTFIKSPGSAVRFLPSLGGCACAFLLLSASVPASAQTYQEIQNFRIAMTDGAYSAAPGAVLTYNISVTNSTSVAMSNVSISDTVPRELIINSASDNADINGQVVQWSGLTFLPGEMKLLTLKATIQMSVRNAAVIINTAKIDGGAMAQDTTIVQNGLGQGVGLSVTHNPDTAVAGQIVSYTLRLTNSEQATKDIDVRASFSRKYAFLTATDQGHPRGNQVEWNNLFVDGNAARDVIVSFKVDDAVKAGEVLSFNASIPGSQVEDPVTVSAAGPAQVASSATVSQQPADASSGYGAFPIDPNAYVNESVPTDFLPTAVAEPAPAAVLAETQQIMPQTGIADFTGALENTRIFLRPIAENPAASGATGLSWLLSVPGLLIGGRLARRRR